jgi:uncharacterized protein YceH (UPF0502 family)
MLEGARSVMSSPVDERAWVPLSPRERRVLGVLVEKAKTTPEYYPLTVSALVTGCNQKSNRDPLTNYDADDVEEILQQLRHKGAAVMVEAGGRVVRWKHTLYDWLKVGKVELAVIAELLLRGPQTEGDLRARAGRMEPIADLPTLQGLLEALSARELVLYLSPPGQRRGVVVTHGLYPSAELEKVRQAFAQSAAAVEGEERPPRPAGVRIEAADAGPPPWQAEIAALRHEMETLRGNVESLAAELRALKSELGV